MPANPRWLFGALAGGLALVGPDQEMEVDLDLRPQVLEAVLRSLSDGAEPREVGRLAGAAEEDAAGLVERLRADGGLLDGRAEPPAEGCEPLIDALLAVLRGESLTEAGPAVVCTAEELLLLPPKLGARLERRALRAFIAAVEPPLRQRAYCHAATTARRTVMGDIPPAALARHAVDEYGGGSADRIRALAIRGGLVGDVAAAELEGLDFGRAHRLGPLTAVAAGSRPLRLDEGLHVSAARYALPNLRFAGREGRIAAGRARDPATADVIARAEAAERYATGDPSSHRLLRAAEAELDAPCLTPNSLARPNERQRRERPDDPSYDPVGSYLWVEGTDRAGRRRWVIADAVFNPFADPAGQGRLSMISSSGAAAHTDPREARRRALAEAAERDAFMWTWVQRVSRERVDPATAGAAVADRVASIEADGFRVALVNLTIDTIAVILCALHGGDRLSVGIGASLDPLVALEKALEESVSFLAHTAPRADGRQRAADVRTPEDHARWHQYPEQIERDRFLFGSAEHVALAEIRLPDASEEELIAAVGEPVVVDLSSASSAPFFVARAAVPELVPISFGWDREPLGMPRLAQPKRTHDGRTLGAQLELSEAGPLDPHPFA